MKQVVRIIVGRYYITDHNGMTIDHGRLECPLADIIRKLNPAIETEIIVEEYKNVPNPNP
jgi:hypothetical protein